MKNIKVILQGGLGNQLFQLAFMLELRDQYKYSVVYSLENMLHDPIRDLEIKGMLDFLGFIEDGSYSVLTRIKVISKFRKKILKMVCKGSYLVEDGAFESDFVNRISKSANKELSVEGYFQTPDFVNKHLALLRGAFLRAVVVSEETERYRSSIVNEKKTIFIHVRRGDYITNKTANDLHGVCGHEYYKEALVLVRQKHGSPRIYVISDDITWCKNNSDFFGFTLSDSVVFVERELDCDPFQDMYLMSLCESGIIANSTYSWWGGVLGLENQIVAPKLWFINNKNTSDLLLDHWVSI